MEKFIYFDEAGYTGADLLNREQPYFCLASACYTDDELNKIKSDIGHVTTNAELHFKKLHKSEKGRNLLKKIFTHPLVDKKHVVLGFADKRYCIYAQIVDKLIESYMFDMGYNLYESKQSLLMTNCLYSFAVLHTNQQLVLAFEEAFVNMMRNPETAMIQIFYTKVRELLLDPNTCNGLKDLLSLISCTISNISDAIMRENPFYMDNTLTIFVGLLQIWYKRENCIFDIKFDESKPIAQQQKLIEKLRDMDIPQTEVGYDERKHVYPLPMGNLELVKSEDYFGIQIADAIASAIIFILNNKNKKMEPFQCELQNLPLFQTTDVTLTPSSLEFLTKETDASKDIDPVNFLCSHLNGK